MRLDRSKPVKWTKTCGRPLLSHYRGRLTFYIDENKCPENLGNNASLWHFFEYVRLCTAVRTEALKTSPAPCSQIVQAIKYIVPAAAVPKSVKEPDEKQSYGDGESFSCSRPGAIQGAFFDNFLKRGQTRKPDKKYSRVSSFRV